MKIRHFLFMLLAAGAWASCSDDGDLAANDPISPTEGEAFISLNVTLPGTTAPGTRAGEGTANDNFDDGIAAEYEINDLTVILFDGNSPTATITKVYTTTDFSVNEIKNNGNITSTVSLNMTVDSQAACYALVIANKNSSKVVIPTSGTFSSFSAALTGKTATDFNSSGFFMSSSPIKNVDNTVTLVECFPKSTVIAASEATSNIYLERILGKVEVTHNSEGWSNWTYTIPVSSELYGNDKVAFTNWGLDITNTATYPVRNIDTDWLIDGNFQVAGTGITNRFYGLATNPVRIYYAVDPNYDGTGDNYKFDTYYTSGNTLTALKEVASNNPNYDYCLENTFNVANQKQGQTTRVLMQANYLYNGTTAEDFYMGDQRRPLTLAQFKSVILAALKIDVPTATAINSFTFFTKAGSQNKALKRAKLGSISYTYTASGNTITTTAYLINGTGNTIVADVNKEIGRYDYYKGGVCYYIARVKHFGEDLTPWDNATNYTIGTDNNYTRDYLGRYGIVRNNWYQLAFNTVNNGPGDPIIPGIPGVDPESPDEPTPGDSVNPGNPTDPTDPADPGVDPNNPGTDPTVPEDPTSPVTPTPDVPDDDVKYYIDCTINILSWARRYQKVDL